MLRLIFIWESVVFMCILDIRLVRNAFCIIRHNFDNVFDVMIWAYSISLKISVYGTFFNYWRINVLLFQLMITFIDSFSSQGLFFRKLFLAAIVHQYLDFLLKYLILSTQLIYLFDHLLDFLLFIFSLLIK